MEYRQGVLADAELIALLHADSWRRTYRGMMRDAFLDDEVVEDRRSVWNERLAAPAKNQFVVVAEEQEEICGFACLFGDDDPVWGSLLDNIHVRLKGKSRGVGRCLMREAATWSQEHCPGRGMYLWVMEANLDAQRFYDRLGGSNRETREAENPDFDKANVLRYAWSDLSPLLA